MHSPNAVKIVHIDISLLAVSSYLMFGATLLLYENVTFYN